MKYIAVFLLIISLFTNVQAQITDYVDQTSLGTIDDPILISCTEDLIFLSNTKADWGKCFQQTTDIVFPENEELVDWDGDGTLEWDAGGDDTKGFSPIGDETTLFTGSYNGRGNSIDSLFINRSNTNYNGLFGFAKETTIDSLSVVNADFNCQYFNGAIVGWGESIIINSSNSSGSIKGNGGYSGGLIGVGNNSTINNCHTNCFVTGSYSGGLVGELRCSGNGVISILKNCYCSGSVSEGSRLGGIVGNTFASSIITKCYSSCVVNGTSRVGGLVGALSCNIDNCYSTGSVNGTSEIGGLVGLSMGSISNSYSNGLVTGSGTDIGGLLGINSGTVQNSFWDKQTSLLSTSAGGTGLSTAEMQQMCVYTDSSWDFMAETINGTDNIWGMNASENNGYPFLSWQGYSQSAECCGYTADITAPEAPTLSDVTGECSATATAPTTVDNCAGIIKGTTTDPLTYDTQGTHTITWNFDDGNGNSIQVDQNIVIDDVTNPTITCVSNQNISIEKNKTGYTISGTEFDPTVVDDNCAVASVINDFNDTSSLLGAELPSGTTTIKWTVNDEAGNSTSCSFDVMVSQTVGLDVISQKAGFSFYPNPVGTFIVISSKSIQSAQNIQIIDITGNVVKQFNPETNETKFTIHIEDLDNGIYFIKMNNQTVKFVKQ